MSYISKLQINENTTPKLIGSTLFGICDNPSGSPIKVINDNTLGPVFAKCEQGVTLHVKFTNGNSATSNVKLRVGSSGDVPVTGNFVCAANAVVAFTYDNGYWIVNTSHGQLGTAAYTDTDDYALKENTTNVGSTSNWNAGNKPSLNYTEKTIKSIKTNITGNAASLTTTNFVVPNITDVGSAASFNVERGVLQLGAGSTPQLGTAFVIVGIDQFTPNTPTTIETENVNCDDITEWSDGDLPSLTITPTTVITP